MNNKMPYGKITARVSGTNLDTVGLPERLAICPGLNLLGEQVNNWYFQIGSKREIMINGVDNVFLRGPLTQKQGDVRYVPTESISDCFRHLDNIPTRGEYTATRTGILLNSIWAGRVDISDIRSLLYQSEVEELCLHLR